MLACRFQYAGTVKCHNTCKRHFAIDNGIKQTERTIFLHVISMVLKLQQLYSAFFEETMPKLPVTSIPVLSVMLVLLHHNTETYVYRFPLFKVPYLSHW